MRLMTATILSILMVITYMSSANAVIIDNNTYTTDTNSRLDWLDVTISTYQSYNYVSSRFGVGQQYEGWRYATGVELNILISNYTNTIVSGTTQNNLATSQIDGLVQLLGNTVDSWYLDLYGVTWDAKNGYEEGSGWDGTDGLIADSNGDRQWIASIDDIDIRPDFPDLTHMHHVDTTLDDTGGYYGSFLVRASVPIPAAVWLFGSGLIGLIGVTRRVKYSCTMN